MGADLLVGDTHIYSEQTLPCPADTDDLSSSGKKKSLVRSKTKQEEERIVSQFKVMTIDQIE